MKFFILAILLLGLSTAKAETVNLVCDVTFTYTEPNSETHSEKRNFSLEVDTKSGNVIGGGFAGRVSNFKVFRTRASSSSFNGFGVGVQTYPRGVVIGSDSDEVDFKINRLTGEYTATFVWGGGSSVSKEEGFCAPLIRKF